MKIKTDFKIDRNFSLFLLTAVFAAFGLLFFNFQESQKIEQIFKENVLFSSLNPPVQQKILLYKIENSPQAFFGLEFSLDFAKGIAFGRFEDSFSARHEAEDTSYNKRNFSFSGAFDKESKKLVLEIEGWHKSDFQIFCGPLEKRIEDNHSITWSYDLHIEALLQQDQSFLAKRILPSEGKYKISYPSKEEAFAENNDWYNTACSSYPKNFFDWTLFQPNQWRIVPLD